MQGTIRNMKMPYKNEQKYYMKETFLRFKAYNDKKKTYALFL